MQHAKKLWSFLGTAYGRFLIALSAMFLAGMELASTAGATAKVEAKDFVEPFETQFGELIGPIVGLVALVTVVVWGIRFLQKRAKSAG